MSDLSRPLRRPGNGHPPQEAHPGRFALQIEQSWCIQLCHGRQILLFYHTRDKYIQRGWRSWANYLVPLLQRVVRFPFSVLSKLPFQSFYHFLLILDQLLLLSYHLFLVLHDFIYLFYRSYIVFMPRQKVLTAGVQNLCYFWYIACLGHGSSIVQPRVYSARRHI